MDRKARYQLKADYMAWDVYACDFYALPPEIRDAVYSKAEEEVNQDIASEEEWRAEREREAIYDRQ